MLHALLRSCAPGDRALRALRTWLDSWTGLDSWLSAWRARATISMRITAWSLRLPPVEENRMRITTMALFLGFTLVSTVHAQAIGPAPKGPAEAQMVKLCPS